MPSLSPKTIQAHRAFGEPWYYSIELAPGLYTTGMHHQNVALTRELLSHARIEAAGPALRCLDVGTREGMIPILLGRRGASVVAYDRELLWERLELVSRSLGTEFELIGDFKLAELPQALAARGQAAFDLVVFSGVLYHMFDPLSGLSLARGLVRNGGLLVVETLAAFDASASMHFNTAGRFTPHALWVMSVPSLDYLLRFLRLEPLEVAYLGIWHREGCPPYGRIAVACRAVSVTGSLEGDERITGTSPGDELSFAEFLDWGAVESEEAPIDYVASQPNQVRRQNGAIDLLTTAQSNPPYHVGPRHVRLDLDAKY